MCGVWFGNDDYSPLNRMTGGSLPAQTWHEIMAYAHQGIELKQIAGVAPNGATIGPILDKEARDVPVRPAMLTNKGVEALLRVERLMDEASRVADGGSGRAGGRRRRPPSRGGGQAGRPGGATRAGTRRQQGRLGGGGRELRDRHVGDQMSAVGSPHDGDVDRQSRRDILDI